MYSSVNQRRLESANFIVCLGFQDMISDNRIHFLKCTSPFIYLIIRITILKNIQSLASAVSIKIRDTNNYIECPFSTGSRIEAKSFVKTALL